MNCQSYRCWPWVDSERRSNQAGHDGAALDGCWVIVIATKRAEQGLEMGQVVVQLYVMDSEEHYYYDHYYYSLARWYHLGLVAVGDASLPPPLEWARLWT